MDKTRTAAGPHYTHGSATITVHRVFGEKDTLAELIQAYIAEQSADRLPIGPSQPVCHHSDTVSVRKEAHD